MKEIADAASLPVGTVMSRLARARKRRMRDIPNEEAIEMTCESARELIESYLDDELEAGVKAEMHDH